MSKKPLVFSFIICLTIFASWYLLAFIKNMLANRYEGDCTNYQEKQFFKKPIPVAWEAKFDTCLSGCWGAVFTRVPENSQYPRFSGYVPDKGEKLAEKYLRDDQILKIYGLWTDVSDSYGSVFDNRCVPTVEIERVEIL